LDIAATIIFFLKKTAVIKSRHPFQMIINKKKLFELESELRVMESLWQLKLG